MKIDLKRKLVFTFSIIVAIFMLIGFIFYTKPPIVITEMKAVNDLSEKIKPVFSETSDSALVLVPYKITISNNRFRRIALSRVVYRSNHSEYLISSSSASGNALYFDDEGEQIDQSLINRNSEEGNNGEIFLMTKWKKWKEANRDIIFPFSSKSIYFYKSTMLKYKTDRNTFADLSDDFQERQIRSISEVPIVRFSKKKIDSLYQADKNKKIAFVLHTNKKNGWFEIHYQMKDGTQKFYNMYDSIRKMNREELLKLFRGHPIEGL